MSSTKEKQTPAVVREAEAPSEGSRVNYAASWVGEIAEVCDGGAVKVTFPGNLLVPVEARSTVSLASELSSESSEWLGCAVLLTFEGADPNRPIITGVLRDPGVSTDAPLDVDLNPEGDPNFSVNGRRIHFKAEKELVLKCGRSTIILRENGKLLIRGVNVVSRAAATNRIKGGSINLN